MHLYLMPATEESDPIDRLLNQLVRLRAGAEDEVDDARVAAWYEAQRRDPHHDDVTLARDLLDSAAAREVLVARGAVSLSAAQLARAQAAWPRQAPEVQASPRRGWWLRWPGWVAAAAAAAALWLGLPRLLDDGPRVPGYAIELRGGVAATRGDVVDGGRTFVPTSQVTLVLRPNGALGERPPVPQVFVSMPGGPLQAAPEGAIEEGQGGVWRFRAPGRALFSGASGPRMVHVVFAYAPVAAEGVALAEAKARSRGAGWYSLRVDWSAEARQ